MQINDETFIATSIYQINFHGQEYSKSMTA